MECQAKDCSDVRAPDMEAVPSNYQVATLVGVPSYPNSLVWSKENLVAIPSEHLITIMNPASLSSARAVITLRQNKHFRIGLVERNNHLTPCLQPICLSRDTLPCARSISWSPPGLAPNSGCFLAVCTSDGRVKLYRAPYCEYSSEWIEVVDLSDLLFDHITSINYSEWNDQPLVIYRAKASNSKQSRLNNGLADSACSKSSKSRKRKGRSCSIKDMLADSVGAAAPQKLNPDIISLGALEDNEANPENGIRNSIGQSSSLPYITAQQYASRSAVLSSLVVSWSPVLQSSETSCALLSAGAKSGAVSFWKICEPEHFTIKHGNIPVNAMLIGLIQAHNSWITAISFGISSASFLKSQLVLATGCSDGSVKIWSGNVEGFLLAAEVKSDCFLLLTEVTTATSVPVSSIDLVIPAKSPEHVVLAVGRGAGKLEVWIYDIISKKLHFVSDYNAHEQVITGLSWAFDGCCLYSCSQDNSIRSWIFHGNSLYEAPFSSKFSASNASNLSKVSDLCFGLALSPGELMLAVVRSFDSNLQHQMYEKRFQRAAVEFFWTGGQSLEVPIDKRLDRCRFEAISDSSMPEFTCWETNILWVLKYFENVNKPLVIWDTITLLRDLRQDFTGLVENILTKWISSWFSGPLIDSLEKILFHDRDKILMISSRKMHLLNIICRRVMFSEMEIDSVKDDQPKPDRSEGFYPYPWNELLLKSEREIQERLVAFSFQAVINHTANSQVTFGESAFWSPVGVAQMERWTAINHQLIHSQLKPLGSEVAELRGRNNTGISEYVEEESCNFCSAPVPFKSPEIAWCQGKGSKERHKLTRCVVSMRLCSVTEPLWFCMCCRRWAANLLPHSFFTLECSPLYSRNERSSSVVGERLKPLCPFCGILLQRSVPDFLLSASPV